MICRIILILVLLLLPLKSEAKNYIGLGGTYSVPVFNSADNQEQSVGGTFIFETRRYCNLWLGVKIDYTSLERIPEADEFYESSLSFSPFIKYVFTEEANCYKPALLPYAMLAMDISSLDGTYEGLQLGLGGTAGVGIVIPFSIAKNCFSIDFNASLAAPNLLRADGYPPFYAIRFGAILSVGI